MSFIKNTIFFTIGTILVIAFYFLTYGAFFALGDKMSASGAPTNIIGDSKLGFSIGIIILIVGLAAYFLLSATQIEYETTQR